MQKPHRNSRGLAIVPSPLLVLLLLFLLLSTYACSPAAPITLQQAPAAGTTNICVSSQDFATIAQGNNGYTSSKISRQVIREEAEWEALRARFFNQPKALIDFEKEMVIGVFLGERRTGGYGVEIVGVIKRSAILEVYFRPRAPGSGSAVTQALTYPFHLIKTATTDKPVIFSPAGQVCE